MKSFGEGIMKKNDKWIEKNLSEIALVSSGQGAPQGSKWFGGNNIFVRAGDLNHLDKGKYVGDFCQQVNDDAVSKYSLKKYPENSVVFPKSGMSIKTNNIALLKFDSCVVNHLAVIQPKTPNIELSKFIYYYLKNKNISNLSKNDSYPSIRLSDIRNYKISLPPTPILKKIVRLLDRVNCIKQLRMESNGQADNYLRSIFFKMFGDPLNNINKFKIIKLGNFLTKKGAIKCGPFGSQLRIGEYVEEGIPVYGIDNIGINKFIPDKTKRITKEKFKELKSFEVKPNDVLISRTGTVGRTCLAPDIYNDAIIGPNLLKIRCNEDLLPEYLSAALNYSTGIIKQIKNYSPGATVAVYNTTNLKKLKIILPPIKLQNDFIEVFRIIERIKKYQIDSNHQIKKINNILMKKCFNGEIF